MDSILQWFKCDKLEYDRVYVPYMRFWGFIGLWPTRNFNHRIFRYFYPRFIIAFFTLIIFVCVYSLYTGTHSYTNIVLQCFVFSFSVITILKISTYIFQQKELVELCDDLENIHEGQRLAGIPEVTSKLRDILSVSKFFNFYLAFPGYGILVVFAPLVFVNALRERKHMSRMKYPCDTTFSPCFEAIVAFEIIGSVASLQILALCDTFVADILSQVWGEFKILNHNLENIHEFAVKKFTEEFGEEEKSGSAQDSVKVLSEHCDQMRVVEDVADTSYRRVMPPLTDSNAEWHRVVILREDQCRKEIKDGRQKKRREAAKKLAIDRAMKQRLADCIQHHQTLISFAGDFESIFNPLFVGQFLNNLFGVVTIALYVKLVEEWGVMEICLMICECFLIMELLTFSWLLEKIAQESASVKTAVYSCDWFEATESFKRSMRVIISRSNDPLVIRAGQFVPISLETFASVMNNAYSYLMAIQSVVPKK